MLINIKTKYLLLLLFYSSSRKSLEYFNCPAEVLSADCGEISTLAVIDVFNFLMKYFRLSPCEEREIKSAYSLNVYYQLNKGKNEIKYLYI